MGQEGLVCVPGRLLDHLAHGASKAVSIAVDGTRGLHGVANDGGASPLSAPPARLKAERAQQPVPDRPAPGVAVPSLVSALIERVMSPQAVARAS